LRWFSLFRCMFRPTWPSSHTYVRKNKNNEGKQHRNKTQIQNMQSVTTCKRQRSRILTYENKYTTHLKMAM
jgi:hypothetical protein